MPTILLASNWSFLESIPAWGWVDIGFLILLLAGVIGESEKASRWLVLLKSPQLRGFSSLIDWESAKYKRRSERLVWIGIAGELLCLILSLHDSATLYSEAATANAHIEQLRADNLKLEAQIQPRRISPEQREAILAYLRAYVPHTDLKVMVWSESSDTEASVFGMQIVGILREAGISSYPERGLSVSLPREVIPFGVGITFPSSSQMDAKNIFSAFANSGVFNATNAYLEGRRTAGTNIFIFGIHAKPL
jgi:hypothetical protein